MTPSELRNIRQKLGLSVTEFAAVIWPMSLMSTASRRLRKIETGRLDVPSRVAVLAKAVESGALRSPF